jgi:hypothetical protein
MTLEEYIKNPMGKKNAVFSQRYVYYDLYSKKFDTVMVREAGKINYILYKDSDKRYLIYLKIPSEIIAKFYYDVVIEFKTGDMAVAAENTLKNYEVNFFSNDPAFVFTYAYAFDKNNLFIEDLKPRMSKKALTERAIEKNPKNVVGYVKSLYFAYLFIKLRGLDKKAAWVVNDKYSKKQLLELVENADKKVADRIEKGEEKELEERNKKKSTPHYAPKNTFSTRSTQNTSTSHITKTAINTRTVKHTKTTKRK